MFDFFLQIHAQILDPDRIPVLLMAFLLVALIGAITGPSHGNANPWLWLLIDKLFGRVGARLDRKERRPDQLVFRGFFVTIMAVIFCYLLGIAGAGLVETVPFYGLTEIFFLSFVITCGSGWYALLKLYFAMRDKNVGKGAYYAIARSARTDLSASDDYGITRSAMGFAARSYDKGLVAPALWYLIFGLPGAFMYAGLAACAWRFGKDGFSRGFGRAALALEKLLGFVPSAYAGMLMALAGLFTPTGGMTRAFAGQLRGKGRAPYEQGGLPLTAMAYALDISLGGPVTDLDGSGLKRSWTGPEKATAQLAPGHLRRALYILLLAQLLFIATLLGGLVWAGRIF